MSEPKVTYEVWCEGFIRAPHVFQGRIDDLAYAQRMADIFNAKPPKNYADCTFFVMKVTYERVPRSEGARAVWRTWRRS